MTKVTTSRKTGRARGYIANYKPQAKTLALLEDAKAVLEEYEDHWPLSVRQIFYRLVGAHGYPKTETFYKNLAHHLANARRGRLIPFDAIRDDGITTVPLRHFDDEEDFRRHVRQLAEGYTRNKLASQPVHLEIWCEAAGMIPQLSRVAKEFSVRVFSCSGFDSLTAKKSLADRICDIGKPAIVLHLGDRDPSGQSIFDSIAQDVGAFVKSDRWSGFVTAKFKRVALTEQQVREHDLPTAPPKATDSRSKTWSGDTCQLEAMPPDLIAEILRKEIEVLFDSGCLESDRHIEWQERVSLTRALPAPGAED